MRFRLAVLDFMGTILDQEIHHFAAFTIASWRVLGRTITINEIVALPGAIGGGDAVVCRLILEHLGMSFSEELSARLGAEKDRLFDARVARNPLQTRGNALEAIAWLRSVGVTVAIATNTKRAKILPIYDALELHRWVPAHLVICAGDVTVEGVVLRKKPEPDIVAEAIFRSGFRPQETIMFDDGVRGLKAARATGAARVAMANFKVESLIQGLKAEEPLAVMKQRWDLEKIQQIFSAP